MANKLDLAKKLGVWRPMLEELITGSSNPRPQLPSALTWRSMEVGKFNDQEVAEAESNALSEESGAGYALRHRARVVAYPGLRLEMGRSFHN